MDIWFTRLELIFFSFESDTKRIRVCNLGLCSLSVTCGGFVTMQLVTEQLAQSCFGSL